MKCTRCSGQAEIALRSHNASFCRPCFLFWFERRTLRQVDDENMFQRDERLLIAVSGGKDSLALWHLLTEAGFDTLGFHLQLGIGAYSREALRRCQQFADERNLTLHIDSLEEADLTVPGMSEATHRSPCAACGKAKRYYFDRAAIAHECDVLVTGHNLDDEAARLMGNVLRWRTDHLARQTPVLRAHHERFVRKVKPFFLASEFEIAAYAFMRGIDYQVQECPNAAGATQLTYKRMLDILENESPGSKTAFVGDFLRRGRDHFPEPQTGDRGRTCANCGMPAFHELCSFCSLQREVERKRANKQPGGN